MSWEQGKTASELTQFIKTSLSDRIFICSCSGHPKVRPQGRPTGRLQHSEGEGPAPRRQKGVWHRGRPALPICMFQGVLGAGYQALWLARVLLDGQAWMLRGSHWVL